MEAEPALPPYHAAILADEDAVLRPTAAIHQVHDGAAAFMLMARRGLQRSRLSGMRANPRMTPLRQRAKVTC